MARVVMNLRIEQRPAFDVLIDCAREIRETHGDECAAAWFSAALDANFDLFCRIVSDTRPALRLIQGGR